VSDEDEFRPVTVHHARNVFEGGMIRSALEAAGIPCHIDNEHYAALRLGGSGAFGALPLRIVVPAKFARRAVEVLSGLGLG